MRLLAIAILLILATGMRWAPWLGSGSTGGGGEPPASRCVLGAVGGSPDVDVLIEQIVAQPNVFHRLRSAGACSIGFYRSIADLSDPSTVSILTMMGSPKVIHLQIWNLSSIATGLPLACSPDWTVPGCRDSIASEVVTHLCPLLESGDIVGVGNEQDAFFAANRAMIPHHRLLVLAIKDAVESCRSGVRVGPIFGHEVADDELIAELWDPAFPTLILNAYGETGFSFTTPQAGVQSLIDAERLAMRLGATHWMVGETGFSSDPSIGGSLVAQAGWARLVNRYARTTTAARINAFIALDGRLPSGPGGRCFGRAGDLGGDPANDNSEVFICSQGLMDANGNEKPAWREWFSR